jgi:hypothetical protein
MNNKQQVKLRVLKMYNPSAQILTGFPVYRSIVQAPSHLLEFTAGGQEHVIELPCLSRNRLVQCARDLNMEALVHGTYYIYVAQPMANSTDSPKSVYFNVYMELSEDFRFLGYSTETLSVSGPILPSAKNSEEEYEAQMLQVMNPSQSQKQKDSVPEEFTDTRLQPINDVRSLIRRVYRSQVGDFIAPITGQTNFSIDLNTLIGEGIGPAVIPCSAVSRMYYGKHVGLKVRLTLRAVNTGDISKVVVKTSFAPTQMYPLKTTNGVVMGASTVLPSTLQWNADDGTAFPVAYVTLPSIVPTSQVIEFTLPNTSIFKYIGGPSKMGSGNGNILAIEDFGNVVVSLSAEEATAGKYTIEAGFTDESRLGFHCIAPYVRRAVYNGIYFATPGFGSYQNDATYPSTTPNKFIYYSRT